MNKRQTGERYEAAACRFLVVNGFRILDRNYRCRFGEIDIIAEENGTLCFVEVKYRNSDRFGTPAEAVSKTKQNRIIHVSKLYLLENHLFQSRIRYDIIEILDGKIRLIRDCFGG
ncbi:MAG: YraN family protein [Clostridiales bacterium]|nr:YraN family protein [Clostridiales bacterium]